MKLEFDFKTDIQYRVEVDGGSLQEHNDVLDDVYYYEDLTVGHDVDLYSRDILKLLKDVIENAYVIDESNIVVKTFDLRVNYDNQKLEIGGVLECDLLGNPVLENLMLINRFDKRLVKLMNKEQCFLNFEELYGLGKIDIDTVTVYAECDSDSVEFLYGVES